MKFSCVVQFIRMGQKKIFDERFRWRGFDEGGEGYFGFDVEKFNSDLIKIIKVNYNQYSQLASEKCVKSAL